MALKAGDFVVDGYSSSGDAGDPAHTRSFNQSQVFNLKQNNMRNMQNRGAVNLGRVYSFKAGNLSGGAFLWAVLRPL